MKEAAFLGYGYKQDSDIPTADMKKTTKFMNILALVSWRGYTIICGFGSLTARRGQKSTPDCGFSS
jgi:hypothetical protein